MRHHQPTSPVSFMANVAHLPQKGMPISIEADEAQRSGLAAEHQLVSVEGWKAELLVSPWKRNGVKVSGHVEADITQECVVTLEPLHAHISEEVSAIYFPEDSKLGRQGFHAPGEVHLDLEGADSPETFSGDTIDVGALAEEIFGLAIDPYPRKEGASLGTGAAGRESENLGPLHEKLKSLRPKP
jgi:Large ribosomal RNA subunit accumulation protein YceD